MCIFHNLSHIVSQNFKEISCITHFCNIDFFITVTTEWNSKFEVKSLIQICCPRESFWGIYIRENFSGFVSTIDFCRILHILNWKEMKKFAGTDMLAICSWTPFIRIISCTSVSCWMDTVINFPDLSVYLKCLFKLNGMKQCFFFNKIISLVINKN